MPLSTQAINEAVGAALEALQDKPGPLLPILHRVQDRLGCVPEPAVALIAGGLNLSRAEVHGVISFYPHFRSQPRGRHVIEICRAESCQAMGGRRLERFARETLGLDWHETSRDGQISLEPVYCLGNCACSPSVRVGQQILGRVTERGFAELLDDLGAPVGDMRR